MKTDALELTLLFDYYGELLTEKQQTCFDLYYNQDLSLSEIAGEAGISRQGVHDTLARTEQALRQLEAHLGCVSKANSLRQVQKSLLQVADTLQKNGQPDLAAQVQAAADQLEE